jgi:cold shock CspA family protein
MWKTHLQMQLILWKWFSVVVRNHFEEIQRYARPPVAQHVSEFNIDDDEIPFWSYRQNQPETAGARARIHDASPIPKEEKKQMRQQGKCAFFKETRGKIQPDGGGERLFVRYEDLTNARDLYRGQVLEFERADVPRGPMAVNVTVVDRTPAEPANGVVKTLRADFGFMAPDDRSHDVWCPSTVELFSELQEGDRVSYEFEIGDRGPKVCAIVRIERRAAERHAGTVKRWVERFGFIQPDAGGRRWAMRTSRSRIVTEQQIPRWGRIRRLQTGGLHV